MNHPALSDLLDLRGLRQLELAAEHAGLALMPRAAAAIADCCRQHIPPGSTLLVAAGPGNNGGDALLALGAQREALYQYLMHLPLPVG